jgi:hypothetical protein
MAEETPVDFMFHSGDNTMDKEGRFSLKLKPVPMKICNFWASKETIKLT